MASVYITIPSQGGGPAAGVSTFNGRFGSVVSQAGDYSATLISYVPFGTISSTNVQNAISELEAEKQSVADLATDFSTLDNIKYPTTRAVSNHILQRTPGAHAYYFTSVASDLGGGRLEMKLGIPAGGGFGIPTAAATTGTVLAKFASVSGYPNVTTLPSGALACSVMASQTGGTKTAQLYAEFSTRTILGVSTVIATSGLTEVLTGTPVLLAMDASTNVITGLLATDRLEITIRAAVSGAGTDPDINLTIQGSTYSRCVFPFESAAALSFTPEDVVNKATSLAAPDNVKYPTTQAVANYVTGSPNQLTAYDSSGDLSAAPGLSTDPATFDGFVVSNTAVPAATTDYKQLNNIYTNFNPTVTNSQENWKALWVQGSIGTDNSGNQVGDATNGGLTTLGLNASSTNESDFGYLRNLELSISVGNGTDAVAGQSITGISQYASLNTNTSVLRADLITIGFFGDTGSVVDDVVGLAINVNAAEVTSSYVGYALGGTVDFTGSGNYFQGLNIQPTITGTLDNATGLYVNMNNIAATNVKAAEFNGDVQINGDLTFTGALSIGALNAFASQAVVNGGGTPSTIHGLVSNPTVGDSLTIALADTIGVNTAMLLTIGDNSTVTTALVGLSALALPAVVTMGTGSTVDNVAGATFALSLDGAAGGGTISNLHLCRAVAIPNGITAVTNLYGFKFDLPYGDPGTTTWAFYDSASAHNYLSGNLMVGGTPGSDDTVANSSVGIELKSTTKALLNARLTTTERDALTAIDGMQIYNTTTSKLQVRAGGSWVDLH